MQKLFECVRKGNVIAFDYVIIAFEGGLHIPSQVCVMYPERDPCKMACCESKGDE